MRSDAAVVIVSREVRGFPGPFEKLERMETAQQLSSVLRSFFSPRPKPRIFPCSPHHKDFWREVATFALVFVSWWL